MMTEILVVCTVMANGELTARASQERKTWIMFLIIKYLFRLVAVVEYAREHCFLF